MKSTQIETLATFRAIIGFLGEKENYGWWQSSFFAPGSDAFLAPVFGRTKTVAQCTGVAQAAALVHDEFIGVGHVYHLFRLPEDLEQALHQALHGTGFADSLAALVANRETALDYLRKQAKPSSENGIGPVHFGDTQLLHEVNTWKTALAYYLQAFENGTKVYPYLTELAHE